MSIVAVTFSACSSDKKTTSSDKKTSESEAISDNSTEGSASEESPSETPQQSQAGGSFKGGEPADMTPPKPVKPVTDPNVAPKRLTPDLSAVNVPAASAATVACATEEDCIKALNAFANPNGNSYDALSVLGRFRYANKTDEEMMNQLTTASADWHGSIKQSVGDKCVVNMSVDKKTSKDPASAEVADWNQANSQTAEAYTNVKCRITTNYASGDIVISFDLVKVGGAWYLAQTGTLNKIKNVITVEIFK